MTGQTGPRLALITAGEAAVLSGIAPGAFAAVASLALPATLAADPAALRRAALAAAASGGFDWHVVLLPGERLRPDALDLLTPALDAYDAVFGAVKLTTLPDAVWRPSRAAFDRAEGLFHALLAWWIGDRPFIRTEIAAKAEAHPPARGDGAAPELDALLHLLHLWQSARCLKTAQPLIEVDAEPAPRSAAERAYLLRHLAHNPVYLPVSHGGRRYELPYTGRNATIERDQTRGMFYEEAELDALAARIGPGARVLDVGANTGNHTIYFAGPMAAEVVFPVEPMPESAAVLRASVARNGLANVDLSFLGVGAAGRPGRARAVRSERGGLGATRLEPDPDGEVRIAPLDDLSVGRIHFLKIDVESMEIEVLAGAEGLIARDKPVIFVEVANGNVAAFSAWCRRMDYRVERIFSDKGHANYLIGPNPDPGRR